MKTRFKSSFAGCLQVIARGLSLISIRGAAIMFFWLIPLAAQAQTFTSLTSFIGTNGSAPLYTILAQGLDGNLYGTTSQGGTHGQGTVFRMTPSGVVTTLYNFCSAPHCTDGSLPYAGLVLGTDGNFYGTTFYGGTYPTVEGAGTTFKITQAGKLTTLHSFQFSEGAYPSNALVQGSDGNFYGTAQSGGANLLGTVFKMTPQGTVTNLHNFDETDGAEPQSNLIQASDGDFYGTTYTGGTAGGYGAAFKITAAGIFTTLHSFNDDIDGAAIVAGLVEGSDGNFYGTAQSGGPLDHGTFYSMTSSGTVTVLHTFDETDGCSPQLLITGTNGNFYSTAGLCGANNDGTVLEVTSQGAVSTLHNFDGSDGDLPFAGLMQATDGNLYGVTIYGGSKKDGSAYRVALGLGAFVKTLPVSAKVGNSVRILGTNLSGATRVTFNGTKAAFSVVSATQIVARVPLAATTGTVEVTTPSGTLSSNTVFQVTQ